MFKNPTYRVSEATPTLKFLFWLGSIPQPRPHQLSPFIKVSSWILMSRHPQTAIPGWFLNQHHITKMHSNIMQSLKEHAFTYLPKNKTKQKTHTHKQTKEAKQTTATTKTAKLFFSHSWPADRTNVHR